MTAVPSPLVVAYPVLALPGGRPLLRAGDAGRRRGDPPPDHRRARLDRRLARGHAQDRPARDSLVALQFADKRVFYYGAPRGSGSSGSGCGRGSTAAWPARRWRRSARTRPRRPRSGIHVTRFKIGDHGALGRASPRWAACSYAQYLAYVNPDTLSRHRRVAADRVRGGARRHVRPARSLRGHRADHRAQRVPAHLLRASSSSASPRRSTGSS